MKPWFSRRSAAGSEDALTLFHAADIHGADICWRKFVAAGTFYSAQAIVLGGDLTGKAVVPIEVHPDGSFRAEFLGEERAGASAEALEEMAAAVRFNGMYPWTASASEIEEARADDSVREELFERLILDDLSRWVDLGERRLERDDLTAYVMGGNDDPWSIEAVLDRGQHVRNADSKIVHVGSHELLSLGWSNVTPWHTEREATEDKLYERLKELAEGLEDPSTAIFNIHVPPYDTGLDLACEIREEDLTQVYKAGIQNIIPVGSHAVRQIIEEYQPLLALHGHIHESQGEGRIGRTLVLNPGSEYNSGRLQGVVVVVGAQDVRSWQFVTG